MLPRFLGAALFTTAVVCLVTLSSCAFGLHPPSPVTAVNTQLQIELQEAAMSGDVSNVERLLELGTLDVNWRREEGREERCIWYLTNPTALHYATACNPDNSYQIVRLLIDYGADVNLKDTNVDYTALFMAASCDRLETVRLLLDRNADINAKNSDGWTALIEAARKGNLEIVRLLLDRNADISETSSNGWTALTWAAEHGNVETVRLLLDRGADVNVKDQEGATPLMFAAANGHVETVSLLLDRKADVNAKKNIGMTALMYASFTGQLETVSLLLDRNADINARDNHGYSALMYAASQYGTPEVIRLLKSRGITMDGCTSSFSPNCDL